MIHYVTGDLLKSEAEALVNTVNCEGYMGKGLAYQFKLQYPETNVDYVRACKNGNLFVGTMHYFMERSKLIINFPTKNKWRAKSKMEYIDTGLDALVELIKELNIHSIAIPPLGSGNGGLVWADVKKVIETKLAVLDNNVQVFIYEPSTNYVAKSVEEPKLSLSALVLMEMKQGLLQFNTLRLQKTAYMMDLFSKDKYFKFTRYKFGPYDNSIKIISRNIKEYQKYHVVKTTDEAYKILYNKLVSEKVDNRLNGLRVPLQKALIFVNNIDTNHELECLTTILLLIEENNILEESQIINGFKEWSEDKAKRFSEIDIRQGLFRLQQENIIQQTLVGFVINKNVES